MDALRSACWMRPKRNTQAWPLLFFLLCAPSLRAQALPPNLPWRTLDTEHLRVTFPPELESLGRRAAERGEAAWLRLAATVVRAPRGRIDIVLTDHVDFTNGFARTHPSNRIVVYAKPPVDDRELSWFDDWIDLVVSHELAHVFHLDAAGGVGRAIRTVFGRVDMTWPAFPAHNTPLWSVEGLAVGVESDFTGYGRIHGTWHEMVLRTASLADRFDPFERVSSVSPIWPGGQRVYIYGSLFLEYLEKRYGAGTTARMVEKTTSAVLPPFLVFGDIGRRTIGKSFGSAFREWRDTLRAQHEAQADSLRATGLTVGERITHQGRIALFPRISPDGNRIAYAAVDGREDGATRVLARSDGRRLHAWRRNSTGALAWLPDGSGVVLSQLEFDGPYRARQDLWVVGERGERRITRHARLQDPDVATTGRIVAIENMDGTNRPVLVDMEGNTRALVDAGAGVHWALPRWAPDGARIALARWTAGQYAIVVLDTLGRTISELPDEGVATAPTWSPDGRHIVYSSDRTGIANLYAADLAQQPVRVRQITQVLTGAFMPELSPDGAELVYAAYAADGFHIERMRFDSTTWREPGPVRVPLHADGDPTRNGAAAGSATQIVTEARAWSPLPTVRPYYWEPVLERRANAGDFWGFRTGGEDVIGRHRWGARITLDPGSGRWGGSVGWLNARLGVPILQLEAARTWDDLGFARLPDSTFTSVLEREDALAAFVNFPVRRWRNSATFSLGGVWERVSRGLLTAPDSVRLRDPRDDLFSVIGRVGFANYRTHELSISREDGVSLAVSGRVTRERDPEPDFARDYEEVSASASAYRALPLGGFARPVIALRASGLRRFSEGAAPTSIGGASGNVYDLLGLFELGDGGLLLPVRGFERGVRAGTRAWTASTELRVPVAIPGRRLPLTPFYFDRISLSLFGDAGDASCSAAEAERYLSCESANMAGDPLLSAGAELVTELGIGSWFYTRVRVGLALPVSGPGNSPMAYLQFGSAF